MKRSILFLVCLMGMAFAFAQTKWQDVIYLKNGSVIRGDVVEMVPDETVKIQTFDGSVFVYPYADVEKFAKEEGVIYVPQTALDKKSPWVAGIMSYIAPGMGQFYNGENRKGWVDLGTQAGAFVGILAGMAMAEEGAPYYDYHYNDIIGPDGEVIGTDISKELIHEGNETLEAVGTVLMIGSVVALYVNWIHSVVDAAKSANRINAENGFVMYRFNERCAFGMQPSIAYERPQYMQGGKLELAAGMRFKLTF